MRVLFAIVIMAALVPGFALAADEFPDLATLVNPARKGQTIKEKQDNGTTTEIVYDQDGRLIQKTTSAGTKEVQTWQYTYSQTGQLLSVTDPLGLTTIYQYDTLQSKMPSKVRLPDGTIKDMNVPMG